MLRYDASPLGVTNTGGSVKEGFENVLDMSHSEITIPRNERKLFYVFYEITLLKRSAIREQIFYHKCNL